MQGTALALTVQIEPNTYQAGQSTQASTVSAASRATTKLTLDKKFGNSHSCAIDRFLLPATAGTTLVKELGSLGHGHADQLCVRATAASTTRRKLLECLCTTEAQITGLNQFWQAYLEGRSAAQGRCR